jgi:hypothetical protein
MDQLQKKKWKEQEKISGRVSQEAWRQELTGGKPLVVK